MVERLVQVELDEDVALVDVGVASGRMIRFPGEIQYRGRPVRVEKPERRVVAREIDERAVAAVELGDDLVGAGEHPNESPADESGGPEYEQLHLPTFPSRPVPASSVS